MKLQNHIKEGNMPWLVAYTIFAALVFYGLLAAQVYRVDAQSCTTIPAGLVSLWQGENSAADATGANHGTLEGGVSFIPGKVGSAFSFDGVDDVLVIPASDSLNLNNAFTLEFWFSFPFDIVPGSPGFVSGTHFVNKGDYTDFFGIANGLGYLEVGYEQPRVNGTTTSWLANTWYHAALTYDAGLYHLYVNGNLETTLQRNDPLLGDFEAMYFSHSLVTPFNPPNWYEQRLDEIAVYNRALSAEEIAGRAGNCVPVNQPPVCTGATPSIDLLWPPEHQMVDVNVLGVSDPEGDTPIITVNSIFQDEPTNGTGDGDTSPDGAGIGTGTAQLRAERAGLGDGRIYVIAFTATDSGGASCTGQVTVGVRDNMGRKGNAVNSGTAFDATVP